MNKTDVSQFFNGVRMKATRHSPEILTGLGITGMITTTILAVKATPKALILMEEKKNEERVDELKPVEVVKTTWKCYIPAATTGVFSIACLIGAGSVHARRNAALATAYKISETALAEYREKVVETIGEKKEKTVREKVSKERVEKKPVKPSEVIITNNGNTLCLEPLSGRYFKSSRDKIQKAENEINRQMLQDINGYASLNDWYDELGLDHNDVGYSLGWNAYNLMKLEYDSVLTTDGEPCLVIDYVNAPKYGYERF